MIIIPEIPDIVIEDVVVADELTLTVRTISPTACCPCCQTASSRVQSRYHRTLHDLPSSGRPATLIIEVRRFFCKKSTCPRKIFAERLPELCHPYAQRTKRLQEALCRLGLRLGGQAGADAASDLGLSGSRDTILRLLGKEEPSKLKAPRVIGLDDWAWKRRQRYGTLICDLESGLPIDLLADRSVETVSAWLQDHPSVEVVSRDGSWEYASAIKKGAPQARQVSDRWHLTSRLADCVSAELAAHLGKLRALQQERAHPSGEGSHLCERRPPSQSRALRQRQQARHAEQQARYEHIVLLQKEGVKQAEIAAQTGMSKRTIRRWLRRGAIPYCRSHRSGAEPLDPCQPLARLASHQPEDGSAKSRQAISGSLQTAGPSSLSVARETTLCNEPNPLWTFSAHRVTWLFFRRSEDLKERDQQHLQLFRQASPLIEEIYQLVQAFLRMVRQRQGEQLERWLQAVQASQLQAFESFVTSIQKDKDAVLAGLTLSWSNGPLEGHSNRLKLLKRSMYGRAQFDLLKLRVLYQSKKSQERKNNYKEKNQQTRPRDRLETREMAKSNANSQHTIFESSKVA